MVSGLFFNSFEFIFVIGVKIGVHFYSSTYNYPVFPTLFIEETRLSPLSILVSIEYSCFPILVNLIWEGLYLGSQFCSIDLRVCFYASTILL